MSYELTYLLLLINIYDKDNSLDVYNSMIKIMISSAVFWRVKKTIISLKNCMWAVINLLFYLVPPRYPAKKCKELTWYPDFRPYVLKPGFQKG